MSVLIGLALGLFATALPQDPAPREGASGTLVVTLRNASVDDLRASLRALVPQRGASAPRIAADPRTNSLIVSGTPQEIEAIQDLVAKLDVPAPQARVAPAPPRNEPTIGVLQVEHRRADRLAEVVNQVFATGPVARGEKPLRVVADSELNVLIAYAPRGELERLKELVALLDRAPREGGEKSDAAPSGARRR